MNALLTSENLEFIQKLNIPIAVALNNIIDSYRHFYEMAYKNIEIQKNVA